MSDEIVPIVMFGSIAATVIAFRYFRHKERMEAQELLRSAYEKGQPLAPDVINAIQTDAVRRPRRMRGPEDDLRRGIVGLGLAGAFLTAGFLMYHYDPSNGETGFLEGIAAFPGFIGIAHLITYALLRNKEKS
jgi:hypothetical protein